MQISKFDISKTEVDNLIKRIQSKNSTFTQERLYYQVSSPTLLKAVRKYYSNFSFNDIKSPRWDKFFLSKEEAINLIERVKSGVSTLKKECTLYNIKQETLIKRIKEHFPEIDIREITHFHKVDHNFFDEIGPNQAYILGLIASDGHVTSKKWGHRENLWKIGLQQRDCYLLEAINLLVKNKNKVLYHTAKIKNCHMGVIRISSKKMVSQLLDLDITPRKSLTYMIHHSLFKNEDLFWHFLRGMFDGDGSINAFSTTTKKGKKTKKYTFEISGNQFSCQQISTFLHENFGFGRGKINRKKNSNTCRILIGGNNQVCRLFSLLYKNADLYLKRKYNKAAELFIQQNLELPRLNPESIITKLL